MTEFVDLAPAADAVAKLLPHVPDELLPAATPCADISVAELLGHLMGLSAAFRAGARKEPDSGPPARRPELSPDWRTALPDRLDALAQAWRVPEARAGVTSVGGVEMPAATMAVVALNELVLHGWDLARAIGEPYQPDPSSAAAALGFVAAAARPEGVPGLFGPPVPVPADAPTFHRLLGLSGRDPDWSAGPAGG